MLPIKLTIKGIYSYREEQTIEFDKLTEAHIFGIFGAVGSGKSTILEAITFALYGETERLNTRENRAYNMLNLKSTEMKVDFEFRVRDEEYKAVVSLKRKKNFAEINVPTRVYYQKKTGNWEAQEDFEVAEKIGLSYENFRRTVIIPQGKFQEFLQLSATDRSRMLSEIFSLQKYDLADKVGLLAKSNNEQILVSETKKEELGNIDTTSLQNAENEILELGNQAKTKNDSLNGLRTNFQAFEQLKQAFEKQILLKTNLDSLLQKEEFFSGKAKTLADFEECQLVFKSLFDQEKQVQDELNMQIASIQKLESHKTESKKSFSEVEQQFEILEEAYQKRDSRKIEVEDLIRISEILKSIKKEQDFELRIKAAKEKHAGLLSLQNEEKEKHSLLVEKIKQLRGELPNSILISNLSVWFSDKKNHLANLELAKKEKSEVETKEQEVRKEQEKLVSKNEFKIQNINQLKEIKLQFENNISNQETAIKSLEVKHQLEQYAHNLHDGEPCPLCGSEHHPDVLKSEDVNVHLKVKNAEIEKLKLDLKAIQNLELDFQKLKSRQEELNNTLSNANQKVESVHNKLKEFLTTFQFEGFSVEDENASMLLQEKFLKSEKLISESELEHENLSKSLNNREDEIKVFEDGFVKADKLINDEKQTQKIRLSELKIVKLNDFSNQNPEEILEQAQKIQQQISETEKQFLSVEKQKNELRESLVKLDTSISEKNKNLLSLQSRLAELKEKIASEISKSSFLSRETIVEILQQNIQITELRREIEAFNNELALAKSRWKDSNELLEGKTFNETVYMQLKQELAEVETELKELESQKSILASKLEENKQKLARILELEAQLVVLNLRKENLNVLAGLFKASGFVRYVSNIYLQQLCNAANARFHKLTRQSLQLEVDDKENLNVRDFLNDGQLRSVKTLSGGQTFQASLCLALALADSIQSLNQADRNFFFLDEGFGSLDKDSLQTVFETLKSLRKENRIVGVISHVEDLQQEIDNYLSIVNDSERGSLVRRSWE